MAITFAKQKKIGRNRIMQGSISQSVNLINPKFQSWAGRFRDESKRIKKRSKNQTFDYSEGHDFLWRKI